MHKPYPSKELRSKIDTAILRLVNELRDKSNLHETSIQPVTCFVVNSAIASSLIGAKINTNSQKIRLEDLYQITGDLTPALELWSQAILENLGKSISRGIFRQLQKSVSLTFQESCFWDAFSVISENSLHHSAPDIKSLSKSSLGKFPTPFSLANYILQNSLKKNLLNLSVDAILRQTILDPAAGAGIFLGIAYDMLLAYYKRKRKELNERGLEDIPLSDIILSNNLFAVDISEASHESLTFGMRLRSVYLGEELPQKIENFRIGNALLDVPPDMDRPSNLFSLGQPNESINSDIDRNSSQVDSLIGLTSLHFPQGDGPRFKPFIWRKEFPNVFLQKETPGFDLIVGNPPYVNIERLTREEYRFFTNKKPAIYRTAKRRFDLYVLFLEKILTDLLRDNGFFGFVLPDKLLTETYSREIRRLMLSKVHIKEIVDLRDWITFPGVSTRTVILLGKLKAPENQIIKVKVPIKDPLISDIHTGKAHLVVQDAFKKIPNYMFRLRWDRFREALVAHIHSRSIPLRDICYISWGAQPGQVNRVIFQKKDGKCQNDKRSCLGNPDNCVSGRCKKLIKGRDIDQYQVNYRDRYLIYDPNLLNRPAFPQLFKAKKILVREVSGKRGLIAALDSNGYFTDHSLSCVIHKKALVGINPEVARRRGIKFFSDVDRPINLDYFLQKFVHFDEKDTVAAYTRGTTIYRDDMNPSNDLEVILAILNSKLLDFYFKEYLSGGLNVFPGHIKQLPIPSNIASSKNNPEITSKIEKAVRVLQCSNNLNEPSRIEVLRAIDRLVYSLYSISEDWIHKIEKETPSRGFLPTYDESFHSLESY
ncbi:MAG: Eco57I restriction-modification methylase domain-containing protein [Candidatus Heimdallarchaeota archaeon]